jgi:RNA polymerase sigma-70 factor (ECF subfamily)
MTDPNQFAEFMRSYQNMVFSTAVRLVGNEAEAEDISQEVFLKAYERFEDISQSPTAGGWLKTVTRNLCLNHLSRYRARWRFFSELFSAEADDDASLTSRRQKLRAIKRTKRTSDGFEQALQSFRRPSVPLVLFHFENLGQRKSRLNCESRWPR